MTSQGGARILHKEGSIFVESCILVRHFKQETRRTLERLLNHTSLEKNGNLELGKSRGEQGNTTG